MMNPRSWSAAITPRTAWLRSAMSKVRDCRARILACSSDGESGSVAGLGEAHAAARANATAHATRITASDLVRFEEDGLREPREELLVDLGIADHLHALLAG